MKVRRALATLLAVSLMAGLSRAADTDNRAKEKEPTRRHFEVTVKSDNKTWISFAKVTTPWKWNPPTPQQGETLRFLVPPGEYVLVGRRRGFRDTRVALVVRDDVLPPPAVTVACTESVP